jgi:hypothetical protein
MLNTLQEFLERQKDFHTNVKHKMLRDLNEKSGKYGTWKYDDGFFYVVTENPKVMLILKGDFEPYVFDTLAALPEQGWPTETTIYGYDDISQLVDNLIEETKDEEETNELDQDQEKPPL